MIYFRDINVIVGLLQRLYDIEIVATGHDSNKNVHGVGVIKENLMVTMIWQVDAMGTLIRIQCGQKANNANNGVL